MAKVDAHEITPDEYDELPELTDEMVAHAIFPLGGRPVPTSPPMTTSAENGAVLIRLSPAVLTHFRAGGPGWQRRIDEILLDVAKREGAAIEE